jgi:hypothetical protein
MNIVRQRLSSQHLIKQTLKDPTEVVSMLGAVQSQDFAGAKWALAMRLKGDVKDEAVEQAFTEGRILRTHVLRPTWHFVTAEDIHWILQLTAPRVHAFNAYMYRQLELDKAIFRKSNKVIIKALQGNHHLTRTELGLMLKKAGIVANNLRLTYLMMYPELEGIICSGPRNGKQFTYALLEERAPKAKIMKQDEALAELANRYFATRGPATVNDFAWWSGLTLADARRGIESIKSQFTSETIDGKMYWFSKFMGRPEFKSPLVHLLPNYDEYFIGFKDRAAIGEAIRQAKVSVSNAAFLAHIISIDGQLVGGWRRLAGTTSVALELNPVVKLTKTQELAINDQTKRFGKFLDLPIELV